MAHLAKAVDLALRAAIWAWLNRLFLVQLVVRVIKRTVRR